MISLDTSYVWITFVAQKTSYREFFFFFKKEKCKRAGVRALRVLTIPFNQHFLRNLRSVYSKSAVIPGPRPFGFSAWSRPSNFTVRAENPKRIKKSQKTDAVSTVVARDKRWCRKAFRDVIFGRDIIACRTILRKLFDSASAQSARIAMLTHSHPVSFFFSADIL